MIVDDEPSILDVSKEFFLLDWGITVDTEISAEHALELIKLQDYDVIVSDYEMPKKNGIQFLKEIRSLGSNVPFILFTGKGREEVVIEALNAGADYYLQKGGDPRSQFAELKSMMEKSFNKRQMEKDLAEKEERFENIFNSANDSIYILDPDGRILEINQIGCDWLGYAQEELLGKNIMDIDSEEQAKLVPERLRQVIEGGGAQFETEWVTKGGVHIPVEISSRMINYEGHEVILSVAREITERKKAEEALRENEERYRTFFTTSHDCVFITTVDGKWLDFNDATFKLFGYESKEDMLKTEVLAIYANPTDREKHTRYICEKEFSFEYLVSLKKKDGTIIDAIITAVPLKDR
ncbi:MAG: PAS domain S-box protein, partial [Methanomassiliicoccales archaeon]